MSHTTSPTLDPVAARRWQQRLASGLSGPRSPWLHEEVARRMQERLDFIRLQPRQWAHWEPLAGGWAAQPTLVARYPQAACWLVSECPQALHQAHEATRPAWWQPARWRGPSVHLSPPEPASMDMIWSNMHLHWEADPMARLRQWHGLLAVDGFVMFSCLGPDTLRGLRAVYAQEGWGEPHHAFTDMHDLGDMMIQAGFAEPVMDTERITLSFASPERLLQELRELGRNAHVARPTVSRGRTWRGQLLQALMRLAQPDGGGALALEFEIVYGHALKPRPRAKMESESVIGLNDMRQMLKRSPVD